MSMQAAPSKLPSYRPEIDGLRAIAVLGVVFFHAGFGPPGGFVGVDVFFVISGYLMTLLLETEWTAQRRIDAWAFFARRIRRLFPMLVTVVLVTSVATCFLLSPYGELEAGLRSAASSLVFAANIFFQLHSGGYFDPRSDLMPLLHLWSLGVEEQFYLLWPLLFIIARRWGRRPFRILVAALALVSLVASELLIATGSQAAFFSLPSRWWELAVGAGIALMPRGLRRRSELLAAIGTALVILATCLPTNHFPGVGAIPAVLGSAAILFGVHSRGSLGLTGRILASRLPATIGRLSYSLYLWHWPLLALASASFAGPLPMIIRAGLVVGALLLSAVSYRWIETPFRRQSDATQPRRMAATSAFASLALAFALLVLGDSLAMTPPPTDLASWTAGDQPANRVDCHYRGDQAVDPFPRDHCTSQASMPVRVAIWGDSHAFAMQPFAWAIAGSQGSAAQPFTRDACAPAIDYDNGKRVLEASRCEEFNARVLPRLRGMDTVVLTALWPAPSKRDFGAHLTETVRRLAPTVRHIILLGETPLLREEAPTCIRKGSFDACDVPRGDFDSQFADQRALLIALASRFPNVSYVDPASFFCDARRCPAVKDGYGLYWDTNHVASKAARRFAESYLAHQPDASSAESPSVP